MEEKIHKRSINVFENRDSTENDLYKCHALELFKITAARQKMRQLS